jgi:hypothetical protein
MKPLGTRFLELKGFVLLFIVCASVLLLVGQIEVLGYDSTTFGLSTAAIFITALLCGLILAVEMPRIAARTRKRRLLDAIRGLFWSWSVLCTFAPAAGAAYIWIATHNNPYSAIWSDVEPHATPAGQTGTYIVIFKKWILVERGEIWMLRDRFVRVQGVAPRDIPLGHEFESPMHATLHLGNFEQYNAEKYWGVGSRFCGFNFNWESHSDESRLFVSIPIWIFLLPAAVVLALRVRKIRRALAIRAGTCACGYDLRAHRTGEKCPECGTVIALSTPLSASP